MLLNLGQLTSNDIYWKECGGRQSMGSGDFQTVGKCPFFVSTF